MTFPLSATGELDVGGRQDPEQIAQAVYEMLSRAPLCSVTRNGLLVEFRGGFRRFGLTELAAISRGAVEVVIGSASPQLLYTLHFGGFAKVISACMVPLILFILLTRQPQESISAPMLFLLIGWLWLFGVNYFTTVRRFRLRLRAGLTS